MHVYAKLESQKILTDEPAGTPKLKPADDLDVPTTLVTTLDNGLRIASQETYGQLSTYGLLISAGARYDAQFEKLTNPLKSTSVPIDDGTGISHLAELMAFKGSTSFSPSELVEQVESMGGAISSSSGREELLLSVDTLRSHMPAGLGLLAATINSPVIAVGEIDQMKQIIAYMHQSLPPQHILRESLQAAAYGADSQLGLAHLCTHEKSVYLTQEKLERYRRSFFSPERMVLSGAGVDHDEFVDYGNKYFGSMERSDLGSANDLLVPSAYIGGESRITMAEPPPDGLVRVAVAFECSNWHDDDLVATCVLQVLLGGGDSFSAGGPGKGMYSRLYREVLNRFYWVEAAEAFTSIHSDSGMIGIAGASSSQRAGDLLMVFLENFARLACDDVQDDELQRAKNMLRCNVLTQLESRMVLFEDIGRQLLTYGKRESPQVICKKIEAVTAADIRRVGKQLLSKKPSISCVGGDISHVPMYERLVGSAK